MSTQTNTKTTLAAGLPGLRKTLRGLAGMASALALAGAISVALQTRAEAAVITSQVGLPAPTGSTGLGDTLTGGFTASRADLGWSHAYGAITDAILSVTLRIRPTRHRNEAGSGAPAAVDTIPKRRPEGRRLSARSLKYLY